VSLKTETTPFGIVSGPAGFVGQCAVFRVDLIIPLSGKMAEV